MAKELQEHNRAIEELKTRLTRETEQYKARLRNSEFVFRREYEAASALVALTTELLSRHADPYMDDNDALFATFARHFDETSSKVAAYLSRHSAILPGVV
jgi:hypothetical protein